MTLRPELGAGGRLVIQAVVALICQVKEGPNSTCNQPRDVPSVASRKGCAGALKRGWRGLGHGGA